MENYKGMKTECEPVTVLKIEQLREEMETGTCSDGAFRYKDKEYFK